MNPAPLKAREIEAMTFIFTPAAPSPGRRNRWTKLRQWVAKLREKQRRATVVTRAADWSFPGL